MKRHRLPACALILMLTTSVAGAEDYVLRWTAVEHDVSPARQTASQGYVAHFGRSGDRFVTIEGDRPVETAAGEAGLFVTTLGTHHSIVYTMRGHEIVRTDSFPGFTLVMIVRPDARGGCRATVSYRKKGEAAVFRSQRYDGSGPSSATRVQAADITCRVTAPQS